MLEREFMKKWVEKTLSVNKNRHKNQQRYWLRIPDSASGIKPFDGLLFLTDGRAIAIEFKVWRLARKFDYSTVEPHQMKALLDFRGEHRDALIVVYFERTKETREYHPNRAALMRMLKGEMVHGG